MQFLLYLLLYPFLYLISILPFRIIYILSDVICFIVYRVIGYRKKVVRQNIAIALPHLPLSERLVIEKKFFTHLCDIFLEMIKTFTISDNELDRRYKFVDIEVYKKLENEGKSIALLCAHYGSYEWAVSMNKHLTHKGYGIYKKLANPYFNKLVKSIRSRFKATLITTKETIPTIIENYKKKQLSIYGFASDQSPKLNKNNYWGTFMNVNVPIHTNGEYLAKKYDMNMIFLKTKKIKRGFYEATFELLSDNVSEVPDFEITDKLGILSIISFINTIWIASNFLLR